jgi:hypothetical protein
MQVSCCNPLVSFSLLMSSSVPAISPAPCPADKGVDRVVSAQGALTRDTTYLVNGAQVGARDIITVSVTPRACCMLAACWRATAAAVLCVACCPFCTFCRGSHLSASDCLYCICLSILHLPCRE